MRTTRMLSIMLVFATLLSAAVQVFGTALALAQGPPMGPPPGVPGFGPLYHVLDQLNLSTEQRATIDALLSAHRQNAGTGWQQMMAARQVLMQSVHAEVFDEVKIREAAATVAALDADGAVAMARLFQEIRAVLTPEQQQRLQEVLSRPPMPGGPSPGSHGSRSNS